jgi:hypothetical protein
MLLGEITAQLERGIRIGEPCVVVGWHIASAGRKHQVGTAIYGEDGNLCGRAEALWIEPRPAMQSPALADSSSQVDTAHAA